jgi:hypothetical protein
VRHEFLPSLREFKLSCDAPGWGDADRALVERSPTLAGRVAGRSSEGIAELVRKILEVVK